MKKYIFSLLVSIFAVVPVFFHTNTTQADLLETIFTPSKQNNQVIDPGNTKEAVGNTFFKTALGINGKTSEPLIVRIMKTILRLAIMLGVTMGLYVGVRYMTTQDDASKQKELIGKLRNIALGILLALMAYVIVELVQSVSQSTITI